jgi:hypothetical protein
MNQELSFSLDQYVLNVKYLYTVKPVLRGQY